MRTTGQERTLPALFEESVAKYPDHVFLWEKKDAAYRPLTYTQVREAVIRCAAGLICAGVKKGDRVALVSEGRSSGLSPSWASCMRGRSTSRSL